MNTYIQCAQLQPCEDPKEFPETVQRFAALQEINCLKHMLLLYPLHLQILYQQSNE